MSVLALDLGGSHVGCALVHGGSVLASSTVTTDALSLRRILPNLASQLRENCRAAGVSPETCKGVAVGFPAIVDSNTGEILSTLGNKFADSTGADLQAWAAQEFGLPLRIENDAKLALLGERFAGAARGFEDVVMVTLGTGIGAAVMLQNRLLHSHIGQAGAIGGHLTVRFDGRPCVCGAKGCAEAEASTSILPVLCRDWPGFSHSTLAGESQLNFATLFRLRDAGDSLAEQIVDHCIAIWSALTVSLIHAYGPQLILFGGGVAQRGEHILKPLRAYVQRHTWKTSRGEATIQNAILGANAALIGAEALFLEELV
jgi:glucokinase